MAAGEGGGDLDGDRGDEDGPGDPDDDGEGIDEGWSGMPWRLRARPTWAAQGTWCGRGQPTKCHSAQGMPATKAARVSGRRGP